jgi:RNA polymerase sigma factor (sigma-70 family)
MAITLSEEEIERAYNRTMRALLATFSRHVDQDDLVWIAWGSVFETMKDFKPNLVGAGSNHFNSFVKYAIQRSRSRTIAFLRTEGRNTRNRDVNSINEGYTAVPIQSEDGETHSHEWSQLNGTSPEEHAERSEVWRLVYKHLPPDFVKILFQYYFQQATDATIAKDLGLDRASVTRKRNEALKLLKPILNDLSDAFWGGR